MRATIDLEPQRKFIEGKYQAGWSIQKIAKYLNCGRMVIWRRLHCWGIPRRPPGAQCGFLNHRWGKPRPEETKRKISIAHLGKVLTKEHRHQISAGLKGRVFTDEHRKKISESQRGNKSSNWKGGKTKTARGYVLIHNPQYPGAWKQGYVLEQRLVAEKMLGRTLRAGEIVHHIDGDRTNNSPENLRVMSNAEHATFHNLAKRKGAHGNIYENSDLLKGK